MGASALSTAIASATDVVAALELVQAPAAGRVQNYVRGEFGTPKSKRSTRSVPMADEVAGELERLFQASRCQADDDLVFAHPVTGGVLPKANVTRRMRAALKAEGSAKSTPSTT